jgi:hypothetical protein
MAPSPEAIPQAGSKKGLKKVPKWAWAAGGGLALGIAWYIYHRKSAANAATATASNCTCSDGSSPSNGTCSDGSTPNCTGGASGSTGYLVGGDSNAVGDASLLQAIDDLSGSDGSSPSAPTAGTPAPSGQLQEGHKYGSGYYSRGKATQSGFTYLTPQEQHGYTGPLYYEPNNNGKEVRMGKTELLPGTPVYAPTKDLTRRRKSRPTRKTHVTEPIKQRAQ